MAAAGRGTFVLDGVARMRERPIQDLVDGMVQLGVQARCTLGTGCPPVEVQAEGLPSGTVRSRCTRQPWQPCWLDPARMFCGACLGRAACTCARSWACRASQPHQARSCVMQHKAVTMARHTGARTTALRYVAGKFRTGRMQVKRCADHVWPRRWS